MLKQYFSFVFITNLCIYAQMNETNTSITFTSDEVKRSVPEQLNILDLTKRMNPQSPGYYPIEEVVKKINLFPNVSQLPNKTKVPTVKKLKTTPRTGVTQLPKAPKRLNTKKVPIKPTAVPKVEVKQHKPRVGKRKKKTTIKALMKGSRQQITQIPYRKIMRNLKFIDKVNLPLYKRLLVWDIIKKQKPIQTMTKHDLRRLRGLLYDIPEHEFVHINVTDWKIVNFLGISTRLSRRQAGIIGYAMKHKFDPAIIHDDYYINRMKGLICAFSLSNLEKISTGVFKRIEKPVFSNIWSCTYDQLAALIAIAQKPDAYGPLEIWNEMDMNKAGLLLTILQPADFKKFNAMAFKGLDDDIISLLSTEQLQAFNEEQISYLQDKTRVYYRHKIGTKNKEVSVLLSNSFDVTFIIFIIYFIKYI